MSENLTIETERVDDVPLLLAQLERMQVAQLIDQHFPAHPNWQGLSPGKMCVGWLAHLLSQANHRLNHVQPWVERHLTCLHKGLGQQVWGLDSSDDRLARLLDKLSDDQRWQAFETALSQHLIRVYDLDPRRVRLDSTAASGYAQITPDGLFQFGHSKDHRPDLPQVKVQLAALDPLGLPLTSTIVSGNRADDGLYLPEIKKVQAIVNQHGLLYVGDSKMGALATRAYLAHSGDYYLVPLSGVQCNTAQLSRLLSEVSEGRQALSQIYQPAQDETSEPVLLGQGYEFSKKQSFQLKGQPEPTCWEERWLVIRSERLAQTGQKALHERIAQAQIELNQLTQPKRGRRRFLEAEKNELEQAVQAIVKRYQVEGLLKLNYHHQSQSRTLRRFKQRPTQTVTRGWWRLEVVVDEVALQQALQLVGWRVYVTNQPSPELSLVQGVLAYRGEYLIERDFGRLKGRPLSLQPMYLASDERVKGLLRVLLIGLRVLSLIEFRVREQLSQHSESLSGLYAGQPKRATTRPTTERLLSAFEGITLTKISEGGRTRYHLSPLSALQTRIVELLGFSSEIFNELTFKFSLTLPHIREP
jgi:transposase